MRGLGVFHPRKNSLNSWYDIFRKQSAIDNLLIWMNGHTDGHVQISNLENLISGHLCFFIKVFNEVQQILF